MGNYATALVLVAIHDVKSLIASQLSIVKFFYMVREGFKKKREKMDGFIHRSSDSSQLGGGIDKKFKNFIDFLDELDIFFFNNIIFFESFPFRVGLIICKKNMLKHLLFSFIIELSMQNFLDFTKEILVIKIMNFTK